MNHEYDDPVQMIPIEQINVVNTRSRGKEKFKEIIASIRALGLKKPITVTSASGKYGPGKYDLVCGEGRVLAFQSLGDLDRLYANPDCVRILKPLCNTRRRKRISWLSNAVTTVPDLPTEFTTDSNVILVANEWRSVNGNVRALEDRTIILWFHPSPQEVHRKTAEWFNDQEVYRFIGSYMPHIPLLSMRYYDKGRRLREAGFLDWQKSLLQMMLPDRIVAVVAGLQLDPRWSTETQRIDQFIAETGLSRRTYYRTKEKLPHPTEPPRNVLRRSAALKLVGDDS